MAALPLPFLSFLCFLIQFWLETLLRGSPGTSNLSPETPLGHCTGPNRDFHRFWISFWRPGGRPWGPFWRPWGTWARQMPLRDTPQARKSVEKVVSFSLSTKIFKKVRFRIRFFNNFGMIFRCFREWLPSLSLTTSYTIVSAQNIGFVLLFTLFTARQPFERKACLNKNHMRF